MITEPLIAHKPERRTATIHLVVPPMDMPKYMDPAIQEVLQVLAEQGVKPMGPLFSYHHRRPADTFEFEIGFAVNGEVKPQGRVKPSTLPASRVVSSLYTGPYEGLGGAWGELERWVADLRRCRYRWQSGCWGRVNQGWRARRVTSYSANSGHTYQLPRHWIQKSRAARNGF